MKIKLIDSSTKKPLINTEVYLQVKGQEGTQLTYTTDMTGMIDIDGKYNGEQICGWTGGSQGGGQGGQGGQGPWVTASENAVMMISTQQTSNA